MGQLRDRSKEASTSFYLTLISVIASLAFGYLLTVVSRDKLIGENWSFLYWLQIVATLQAILLTWHEYVMGSVAFRFVIDYVDSLIPYAFGIVLFVFVSAVKQEDSSLWLWTATGFAGLSALAYVNQNRKAKREIENAKFFKAAPVYEKTMMGSCLSSCAVFAVLAVLQSWYLPNSWFVVGSMVVANAVFIVFAAVSHLMWRKAMSVDEAYGTNTGGVAPTSRTGAQ